MPENSLPVKSVVPSERALLFPSPEELPPLAEGNDNRNAAIWFGILLISIIIIVIASGRLF